MIVTHLEMYVLFRHGSSREVFHLRDACPSAIWVLGRLHLKEIFWHTRLYSPATLPAMCLLCRAWSFLAWPIAFFTMELVLLNRVRRAGMTERNLASFRTIRFPHLRRQSRAHSRAQANTLVPYSSIPRWNNKHSSSFCTEPTYATTAIFTRKISHYYQ